MLQFFSASTNIVNSKRAITECLENALEGQPNLDCDLIIIYSAMGHNFKDLLTEAHRISPGAQIVGCTCGGIIGKEGPDESMKALAIMAVKGPKNEFAVSGLDSKDYSEPYSYGRQLALNLKEKNPAVNMIILYPSWKGLIYKLGRIIEGIESVFGKDVPIIGGVSFDGKFVSDFQFFETNIFEQSAVIVGLADSSLELITQANHGLDIIEPPFEVTKAEYNQFFELNGRNPWEILMEKLQLPLSTSPLEIFAYVTLAIEIPEECYGEYGSRHRVAVGLIPFENGSMFSLIPCPAGTKFWLTRRNEQKIFEGIDSIVAIVLKRLNGRIPVAIFHADCATRGKLLFNQIMKDEIIKKLQYPLCKDANIPWLGMYGGGELTPLGGKNMLQVYTSSLYVLVHKK